MTELVPNDHANCYDACRRANFQFERNIQASIGRRRCAETKANPKEIASQFSHSCIPLPKPSFDPEGDLRRTKVSFRQSQAIVDSQDTPRKHIYAEPKKKILKEECIESQLLSQLSSHLFRQSWERRLRTRNWRKTASEDMATEVRFVAGELQVGSGLSPSIRLTACTGTYDVYTIHSIMNTTPVLHVSFPPANPADPFPNVVPMIGVMGSYSHPSADLSEPLDCYLHGYVSSGIMKAARANPETGLPLTISATKVDGLVLSLTPNSHSYNYRSAVLFGYGSLVEDIEEKLWAMELVTNSVVPNRWSHARIPPDAGEMASTTLMRVRIVSGSGKIRDGGPHDDKKDTERADVVDKVWTGVIPVYQTLGEPIRGGDGKVTEVPEHVRSFCEDVNEENKDYAETAAKS